MLTDEQLALAALQCAPYGLTPFTTYQVSEELRLYLKDVFHETVHSETCVFEYLCFDDRDVIEGYTLGSLVIDGQRKGVPIGIVQRLTPLSG
jgi:hypothetical protein